MNSGRCVCGGVRYVVDGPLRPVSNCHCQLCRRFTGHHTAATATSVSRMSFSAKETLSWYRTDVETQYGFCSECGASLFWRTPEEPDHISIMAGTLDQPTGLQTDTALFMAEHGEYHTPEPAVEEFPADRPSPG